MPVVRIERLLDHQGWREEAGENMRQINTIRRAWESALNRVKTHQASFLQDYK